MSWLVCDGTVLASLEIADTRATRRRGLLGRDGFEGALLLRPVRSVHTIGMRFPIDIAWCDDTLTVLRRGEVVESGTVEEVFAAPREEYTRRLIASIPARQDMGASA